MSANQFHNYLSIVSDPSCFANSKAPVTGLYLLYKVKQSLATANELCEFYIALNDTRNLTGRD